MRGVFVFGLALVAGFCGQGPASALVRIDVDLGKQRIHVASDSGANFDWPISSGAFR